MEQDLEQKMVSGAGKGAEWGGFVGAFAGGGIAYQLLVESATAGRVIALSQDNQVKLAVNSVVGAIPGVIAGGITGALTGAAIGAGTYYAVKAYRSLTEKWE